jgi:hypothetical protein
MKICIHTVIKDELDEYLTSWLNHHTKMVDHIFIYEDIDSHSHKHITDKYPNVTLWSVFDIYEKESDKQRLITNRQKGGINQRFYIRDGVLKIQALNQYDWCFAIDIDEYITLEEPYKAISDVLSDFQDKDGIVIQWMNFGASGRIYKPNYGDRDYREFYTERGEQTENDKTFAKTSKVCWNLRKINSWNLCGLHCGAGNWVMTNGKKERRTVTYEKMYLKHYITRSWEEYLWKIYKRGNHCFDRHRKIQDFFQINPDMKDKYNELIKIKDELY